MIIDFKVGNFLSYNEIQIFSMKAGKIRNNSNRLLIKDKSKFLKFMATYGANASGKSNLVKAFEFFQETILDSLNTNVSNLYCKLNDDNKEKESYFQIKILLNNKCYIYGFKAILNKISFTEEWLLEELKNGTEKTIFSRNISNDTFIFGESLKKSPYYNRLKIYAEDIKSDNSILFLKAMNQNKDKLYTDGSSIQIFKDIYEWILFKLSVNLPDTPITTYSWLSDKNLTKISEKLEKFGVGIESISLVKVSPEKITSNIPMELNKKISEDLTKQRNLIKENNLPVKPSILIRSNNNMMFIVSLTENNEIEYKSLEFKHSQSSATFSLEEESDGTIRLLDLIEVLLNEEDGKTYIIDEINRRFHPLLTQEFIQEYLKLAETRNIQLIVTTHESKLMDLKLLRKDEIAFVNKEKQGNSCIYSLNKYDDRFDKKVLNEYFSGKYDAIPHF